MRNTLQTPQAGSLELIDTKELSKRLKLCRGKIHLMVKAGEIPQIKIGRSSRFDWNEVLESLKKPTAQ